MLSIASYLFTPTTTATKNMKSETIEQIFVYGTLRPDLSALPNGPKLSDYFAEFEWEKAVLTGKYKMLTKDKLGYPFLVESSVEKNIPGILCHVPVCSWAYTYANFIETTAGYVQRKVQVTTQEGLKPAIVYYYPYSLSNTFKEIDDYYSYYVDTFLKLYDLTNESAI